MPLTAYDGGVPLRLATLADLPQIMRIIRRVVPSMVASGNNQWTDTYPDEAVFALDVERGELWIAESGEGLLTGVVALTTAPGHEYAAVGWDVQEPAIFTHRLAVDPDYRGQGIAAALMQQAEPVARAKGIDTLRVDTGALNLPARRLIERLGYRFVAEILLAVRPGLYVRCYERRLSESLAGTAP